MHKTFGVILLTMVILFASSPSFALSGLGFLAKSPIAYFTPEESRLFKKALYDVLDNQPDGKTVQWKNEQTGHFGKIKSVDTVEAHGIRCRTVIFFSSAGGTTGKAKFNFCRRGGSRWQIQ